MANDDQLKILMKGRDAWNQWREKNVDITPNLRTADLNEIFLPFGINLQGADLRRCNLTGAALTDAAAARL